MNARLAQIIGAALATGALALSSQAVVAQQESIPAPQTQSQTNQMQVDDQTVSNFVKAYEDVREIHTEYSQKMQSVEDSQQATDLQLEAQNKMEEAVANNDITVDEYQRIAQQIVQDAELRSRIQAELQISQEQGS